MQRVLLWLQQNESIYFILFFLGLFVVVGLFFFWFCFLLVPVGKHPGRFVTSIQFPGACISFPSSRQGRCSLAGGFGWDAGQWEKNGSSFFAQEGSRARCDPTHRLQQTFPGRGAFRCARLPFRRRSPNEPSTSPLFLSVQQRTEYFPF